MSEIDKRLVRLAVAIHTELERLNRNGPIQLPVSAWDRCVELLRQSHRAESRGWHLAAQELQRELSYSVDSLKSEVNNLAGQLPRNATNNYVATVSNIYADLLALADNFHELDYDIRNRWIRVTTEPITLEDIYLGPFDIRLDLRRITADYPYRVIAQDPHPCESRENVTHPHVMDEHLCEGDSRRAIRQALKQGRLLDFFTLVANGLRSYNSDSPFVALEIWYGATCADCGVVMDEDDFYTCQKCNATICNGCECCCASCDESCCSDCTSACELCDENCCRNCLKSCCDCRRPVCANCLHTLEVGLDQAAGKTLAQHVLRYPPGIQIHPTMLRDLKAHGIQTVSVDDERCINCHEQKQRTTQVPRAPLQPHSVGQVVVPA
jgi:hypothetical protein